PAGGEGDTLPWPVRAAQRGRAAAAARVRGGSWRAHRPPGRGRQPSRAAARCRLGEAAVNGHVLQFYFHQAMAAYRAGRNRDFRQLRDVMQALLVRPLEKELVMARMLRLMQFLSRVEEGENLDCTFDKESDLTPLESAIGILELIHTEFSVTEETMETLREMVKEAAVIVCIRNREFEKAAKIVKRHIGKEPRSQKKKNELLTVIRDKDFSHPMVRNFSYKNFQQSTFQFLETYMDNSEPLLLTVRVSPAVTPELPAAEPAATPELPGVGPSGTVTTYGISVLREAFKILSNSQDSDALFTKLDETDFSFPNEVAEQPAITMFWIPRSETGRTEESLMSLKR
uniref:Telomeric repeat binding factor 2 n=1 Tax=Strigops habroptila TaxID=2489341 RepID=A0A672U9Z9_STRHB